MGSAFLLIATLVTGAPATAALVRREAENATGSDGTVGGDHADFTVTGLVH